MIANRRFVVDGIKSKLMNSGRRGFSTKAYVTKDASRFVKDGKRIQVGLWLLGTSGVLFTLGTFGGYNRNMRFGMNKIEWRAKGGIPKSDMEWEESYEDFKKFPEYLIRGQPVTIEQYKQMFIMNKVQSKLGPGTLFIHLLPMVYFLSRGYFKGPMKKFAIIYSGLLAAIGLQGTYMDKKRPGLVEGEPLPPKSPNQLAFHNFLCFTYFGYGFWMALNMLRKAPNNIKRLDKFFGANSLRRHLMVSSHVLFPAVLITGFLMAGTGAGRSITTYPKVGDNWTLTSEDLDKDESFLTNLYTNRKLIHFNHRTLGIALGGLTAVQWVMLMRTKVGPAGKLGFTALLVLLLGQLHIGGHMVTHKMQPEQVITHELSAFLILTTFLYLMHIVRKPNPEVIRKIASNLKELHPKIYQKVLAKYPKQMKKL
mmetsp:Transcript_16718/g.14633  ORF Transcript_16718/g.14633 Transcript_16718/m.14633 type:complete len:424 (+) Transcript_16718:1-1272(+)